MLRISTKASGTGCNLSCRFFGSNDQSRHAEVACVDRGLETKRGLSDSRRACDEGHRTRQEPSAKHTIDLVNSGRDGCGGLERNLRHRNSLDRLDGITSDNDLFKGVPRFARRAATCPTQRCRTADTAVIRILSRAHGPRLGTGYDGTCQLDRIEELSSVRNRRVPAARSVIQDLSGRMASINEDAHFIDRRSADSHLGSCLAWSDSMRTSVSDSLQNSTKAAPRAAFVLFS